MMNRQDGIQQKMLCVTLESLMPEKHFLRDLDRLVNFDFVYEKVEPLYSHTGRPSIDPVVIIKMMLLGYLYGIDSERKLEQEVQVNIAFRWFLGLDLDEPVPDHSTFSQLRRRKFGSTNLFEEIFDEVVRICMDRGLITGKLLLTDSTHVRANARNDLYETVTVDDEPSSYIRRLNERAVAEGLLPKDYEERPSTKQKEVKVSKTDPDSGYMHRPGKPNGFYYLSHQTCDAEHGLITDVLVTPGNASDRSVHSMRIQYQIDKFGFQTKAVCGDKGTIVPKLTRICWNVAFGLISRDRQHLTRNLNGFRCQIIITTRKRIPTTVRQDVS
jgi:transposase